MNPVPPVTQARPLPSICRLPARRGSDCANIRRCPYAHSTMVAAPAASSAPTLGSVPRRIASQNSCSCCAKHDVRVFGQSPFANGRTGDSVMPASSPLGRHTQLASTPFATLRSPRVPWKISVLRSLRVLESAIRIVRPVSDCNSRTAFASTPPA